MCKAIEDMMNDSKAEGIEQGIEQGKAEERAKLVGNLRKIGVPEEQIQKALVL